MIKAGGDRWVVCSLLFCVYRGAGGDGPSVLAVCLFVFLGFLAPCAVSR